MSAEIIEFEPRKAQWVVNEFRKNGNAPLAKLHLQDAESFNTYVERLNEASDRKYENDFVQIYRKHSPMLNVNHDAINRIKTEFVELTKKFQYKNVKISDNVIMTHDSQLDSILIALERYRTITGGLEEHMLPDYEVSILEDLRKNSSHALMAIKNDTDAIFQFIQDNEEDINALPNGKFYMNFVMGIRDSLLALGKIINEYCL